MKKIIVLCLLAAVAILSVACGHVHEFGEWTTIREATCSQEGQKERVCACGEKETEAIPLRGHTDGKWITDAEATCAEAGSKHLVCSVCNATIKTETIPVAGHKKGKTVTDTAASCTEAGSGHVVCSVCGVTMETVSIPAKGHTDGKWFIDVEATCTEAGSKHRVCSTCGVTLKAETIPAKGHFESDWIVDVEGCFFKSGRQHTECLTCGARLNTSTLPGWECIWIPATCQAPKTCRVCGRTEGTALEHQFENHKCLYCGEQESEIKIGTQLPVTLHSCGYATENGIDYFDTILTSMIISSITCECDGRTIWFIYDFEKIYDRFGEDSVRGGEFIWELKDSKGRRMCQAGAQTSDVKIGEKITNEKQSCNLEGLLIFNWIPGETYTLELRGLSK